MAQLKELLEKEELEHLKEVKEDIKEENQAFSNKKEDSMDETSRKKSGQGSKMWVWLAAILVAVVILK